MSRLLLLAVGFLSLCVQETAGARCTWQDAVFSRGFCYKYVKELKTWFQAQAYCESLPGRGTLARISSNSDIYKLKPSTYGFTTGLWIGAKKVRTDGAWRWSDGSPADLGTLWNVGEPNNNNAEDCVEIYPKGVINDDNCGTLRSFICMEKPVCSWQDAVFSNGNCFKYIRETKTWSQAQAYCQSLPGGGTLAHISSNSDISLLTPSNYGFTTGIWIGAKKVKTDGVWRWPDRTPANLNGLWDIGEPNNNNAEDCVEFYPKGRLNDDNCNTNRAFICMDKPTAVSSNQCALWPGSTYNDGKCFKFIPENKNWNDAQAYCQSLPGGGTLAEFTSNTDFSKFIPSSFGSISAAWFGANDINTEGVWRWADQTPANLGTLWMANEPNDQSNNEDCVELRFENRKANDKSCGSLQPFVCMQKTQSPVQCPLWSGSTYNDGKCFKYIPEAKNWNDAQAYCKSLPGGGTLAKFTPNTDFSKFIPSSFGSTSGVWFGANDMKIEGLWRWADQTPANLGSLWNTNEPNDKLNNEDCAELLFQNRKANDLFCGTLQSFVCMQEKEKPVPSDQCPLWSESTYSDGKCFKYIPEAKNWNDAERHCQSLPGGGTLAQFTLNTDFSNFIPSSFGSSTGVWFGANDIKTEGVWRWADQTPANLGSLWNTNEPNDQSNNEDCAELLFANRKANDRTCETLQPFVCMQQLAAKKPSCTAVVDLIYVLDSSGSIGKENYQKQISFTIDLASNFQIGPSNVLVGAVVFSYYAEKYFDLRDYPSISELRAALSATPYMNYTTHTDEALDLITNDGMFTAAAGARSNSYKAVIVITDGQSDDPTKTQQAAARLKSQGITINAVGIGDAVDSELRAIASGSRNVFKVTSFDALKQIVTSVTQQACQGSIG